MGGATKACIGSFCGAALIASIVMIAVSFGVLQNNQLGLNHDTISQSIDKSTLYTSGRHFIGLGHKFVVYPQLQQSLIYSTAADATEPPIVVRARIALVPLSFAIL